MKALCSYRRIILVFVILYCHFGLHKASCQLTLNQINDSIKLYTRTNDEVAHAYTVQGAQVAAKMGDSCEVWKYRGLMASFDKFYPIDTSLAIITSCLANTSMADCKPSIRKQLLQDLAWLHRLAGNYDSALRYCRILLKESVDEPKYRFRTLNSLGAIYSFLGQIDSSAMAFVEAYEIADELGSKNRSILLNNICTLYNDNGFIDKAKQYCEMARKIATEDDYQYAYGLATNTLGCIYNDLDKRDSARLFVREALELELPVLARHYSYLELGRIEEYDRNYEKSAVFYKKAVAIAEELDYPFEEAYARSSLANILIYKSEYKAAKAQSVLALDIYKSLDSSPQELEEVYKRHILALSGNQDPIPTEVLERYYELTDSLYSHERKTAIVEIEEKYQNEKLKVEQSYTLNRLSRQRIAIMVGSLFLALLSLLAFVLAKQSKNRLKLLEELKNSKEQILLLNRELNHRVKNNLTFMTSLLQMQARRTEQLEAKEIINESQSRLRALALIHNNLDKQGNSSLILSNYLVDIVQHLKTVFQLPGRELSIECSVADCAVDAEVAMRIGLIINELVTNSVKHVAEEQIAININIQQDSEGSLKLKYVDNGEGIEKHLQAADSSKSMGLQLIKLLQIQLQGTVEVQII